MRPLVLPLVPLVALLSLTVTVVPAVAQWHQFRGSQAGVAADDPALPDTWSETENVAWKADRPGARLELADRLGRPCVRHLRGQRR